MSEEITKEPAKSRVTHLNIGRVYNLGNYENLRVEVGIDIGSEDDPAKVMRSVEGILKDLNAKHGLSGYDLRRAREAVAKPEAELDEDERARLPRYREMLAKVEDRDRRRQAAREALATLNYTSERRDAKDDWDDDY
jgi:hypothetical protein